jgi:uncharacterized protein YndB with AHSA1/START domain
MDLPPVLRALHLTVPPSRAFELFTDSIGSWWPLPSHGLFGSAAADVGFEDGRLVERSVDGRTAVWGEVLAWQPPDRLLISWHPGGTADAAGEVEVVFGPVDGGGTRIELRHSGWQAFGERAEAVRRSYAGRQAWGGVLDHLSDLAEGQALALGGAGWPGVDRTALAAAYRTFHAEAAAGGFGAPADGGWSAAQVVAHVAVNDGVLAAVVRALLTERQAALANLTAVDQTVLDAWVDRHGGDLSALVAAGRARADRLIDLLDRLDAEQFGTPVPTRLVHEGQVAVDAELPWARVIGLQLSGHLPGHTEQLRALRA